MNRSQSRSRFRVGLRRCAGAVAVVVLLAGSSGVHAQGRTLQGTWLVQVSLLTSCTGGTPLPSFSSLLSFAQGGTLAGTTINPGFAPGQRSPDFGNWAPAAGGGAYTASSIAFINFDTPAAPGSPGLLLGAQRIDQTIVVSDANTFASTATVAFFDRNQQLYRQACATATGRRFE